MPNDHDTLENANFILKGRMSAPTLFVEGYTQLTLGASFAKILFHNVIESRTAGAPELRRAEQYLALPTVQAIELAHLLLRTAKIVQTQMLNGLSAAEQEQVKAMLRDFQPGGQDAPLPMSEIEKNKLN